MERNVFSNEPPSVEPMTFAEARNLLGLCTRFENRDHYFSDREVFWKREDVEIAEGYFGGWSADVYIHEEFGGRSFHGQEALELAKAGKDVEIGRNDTAGDDIYGALMKKNIKTAREYSRTVVMFAPKHGQRTGQYLFNGLPEGAREAVAGMLWDPFYKEMSQYQLEEWILDHLVLSDSGTVTGVITGGKIIWGSR